LSARLSLAAIAGLLMPLAYPPFHFYGASFLAFFPLLLCVCFARTGREASLLAFLTGFLAALIADAWVMSLSAYSGPWAVLAYGMLCSWQGLLFLLFAAFFKALEGRFSRSSALLTAPLLYTLIEYAGTYGPFFQEIIGHSQLWNPLLRQAAPLLGVNYLSFLVVSINAWLALCLLEDRRMRPAKALLGAVLALLLLAHPLLNQAMKDPDAKDQPVELALIQAKVSSAQINGGKLDDEIFSAFLEGSFSSLEGKPQLIIWPENSLGEPLNHFGRWYHRLGRLWEHFEGEVLLGGPMLQDGNQFNAAGLFSAKGLLGSYHKERLFPYGESFSKYSLLGWARPFLPEKLHRDLYSPGLQVAPLNSAAGSIGVTICLESLYTDLARAKVAAGADLLVNLTNDSWFPSANAAEKHFFAGRMRALETGRYFVQSALYGITGVIDSEGKTVARTGPDGNQSLLVKAHLKKGKTLYVRLGAWRFPIFAALSALFVALWRFARPRTERSLALEPLGWG